MTNTLNIYTKNVFTILLNHGLEDIKLYLYISKYISFQNSLCFKNISKQLSVVPKNLHMGLEW